MVGWIEVAGLVGTRSVYVLRAAVEVGGRRGAVLEVMVTVSRSVFRLSVGRSRRTAEVVS